MMLLGMVVCFVAGLLFLPALLAALGFSVALWQRLFRRQST